MSRKKLEKMLTATFSMDYKVRIVMIDSEPHFVVVDVAKILGIQNIRQNLTEFPDDEKKLIDLNGVTNSVYNTYAIAGAISGGWIEYDRITEISIDEEFRNFYNDGGNPKELAHEMKKIGKIKFYETGL